MKNIIILLLILLPTSAFAQMVVTGVVKDYVGEPIIGATIRELDNPSNGTATGIDGDFKLTLKSSASKIVVSYLGYENQTLSPTSKMEIVLVEAANMLGEVEIVRMGFGDKTRISNTASISQATGVTLRQSPSASLQSALAGRLPGLFQIQGSGQPGKDAGEIYIRGIGTYSDTKGATNPLVLIDDIETDIATLNQLSPNDIESISVLKDAGSTAIFGLKGANGVILVTTRRGSDGPAKVTFRADLGFQQPTYKNKFLNSYESLKLLKEMHLNDKSSAINSNPHLYSDEALEHFRLGDSPYEYADADWYDLLIKKASIQQRYNADVQGGTENLKYFVSLGYTHQGGLFKDIAKTKEDFNNDYYLKRYNIRSNFDFKITKDFTLKVNANAILSETNEPHVPTPGESGEFSIFRRILGGKNAPWMYPAYNPDGSFGGRTGETVNPLALLSQGGYKREFGNNVNGNITLEHNLDFITQGLKVRGVMALTNTWGFKRSLTRGNFLTYQYFPGIDSYEPATLGNLDKIWVLPNMEAKSEDVKPYVKINSRIDLIYGRKFGKHNVGALVLGNWYSNRRASDQPDNTISLSTRLSYDFDSRYLIDFAGSYNGSDRFSKNNRYDFFPSVSIGWNLAEEPYMKDALNSVHIEMLKLRSSYGITGSDIIDRYGYLETYKQQYDYFFGESPKKTLAWVLESLANENVKWETEKKFNIGLDLRMLNGKLGVTVDYFYNKRQDILDVRKSLVTYAGYLKDVLPKMNIGKTENKGWDGEVMWNDRLTKDLTYFVKGTFGYAKNKIIEMDEAPSPYLLSRQTGQPIGTIFGFVSEGFYNSQEDIDNWAYDALRDVSLGDLKYKDISGPNGVPDGIIDEYDKVAIGNSRPNFNYGMSFGINYKNFDISTLFQGATGAYLSSETMLRIGSTMGRPMPIHEKRWTHYGPDGNEVTDAVQLARMNQGAEYPILSQNNGRNQTTSTFWLRSANYLRWKNLEVGYNLPSKWTKRIGVGSIRLYGSAQNLITFDSLGDLQVDPESSRTSKSNEGASQGPLDTYPQQRIYNFGCQIVF